jgi:hypothetical protein
MGGHIEEKRAVTTAEIDFQRFTVGRKSGRIEALKIIRRDEFPTKGRTGNKGRLHGKGEKAPPGAMQVRGEIFSRKKEGESDENANHAFCG